MAINTKEAPDKPLKHSGLGIVSSMTPIIVIASLVIFWHPAFYPLLDKLPWFMSYLYFLIPPIGLALAITGLVKDNRKVLFLIIGLFLNLLMMLLAFMWFVGMSHWF